MKPNFAAMSRTELRAYMLEHRDDDDAFYAYMDLLNKNPNRGPIFPAPKTIDDLKNFPELLEKYRQQRQGES
jgi:hypothetical protein